MCSSSGRSEAKRVVELDLRVREQDAQLGRDEAARGRAALGEHLVCGKRLQRAAEPAGLLQVLDQAGVNADHRGRLRAREAEGLRLAVVVPQDEVGDVVGHGEEQLVPLLLGHVSCGHDLPEQDLDVDLVVGAVDPCGVVDRVGEDASTRERVLDPATLGEAEVAALADDAGGEPSVDSSASLPCLDVEVRLEDAFTNVPMPPFQSRSTSAVRMEWISSFGGSASASTPSRRRTSGESGIDFAERGNTPPPDEIFSGS